MSRTLKNILLGFMKLILIQVQVDKNGCKYFSFRIDVYFNKFLLAVETDEKGHTDRGSIFEEIRQKALEKKLGCEFIRINTSNAENGYDLDDEVNGMEAFIDEFQNKKVKGKNKVLKGKKKELEEKLEKELKEKEAEIK